VSKQLDSQGVGIQTDEILNLYAQNCDEHLSKEAQQCLQALESCQFTISKQHFKMYQLNELFIGQDQSSRTQLDVNKLCNNYVKLHSQDFRDAQA